ncbi:helix-turn-helix DNA binding protein [Microbacterium phage Jacko]|nr:helix-turn-helix DNA binding protein [Microbacterium phage Jacko]
MARQKSINEDMKLDLAPAIDAYRVAEREIRAKYEEIIAREIEERRQYVMDLMFIKYAGSGPSEIANSTGISRATVIRWRKEFMADGEAREIAEQAASDLPIQAEPATDLFEFGVERSQESNEDLVWVKNVATGEVVYVIWWDMFGMGENATEADTNEVAAPGWLTQSVMQKAEAATGMKFHGAPWHRN